MPYVVVLFFFFQAEDGIRDLVRSRGLGDVYKRQRHESYVTSHASLALAVAADVALPAAFDVEKAGLLSLIHI